MGLRWTRHQPTDTSILDAEAVGDEYTSLLGQVNGGMTRDNIRDASVTDDMVVVGAIHTYTLLTDMAMSSSYVAAYVGSEDLGATFADYRAGWIPHSQTSAVTCTDGQLHLEYSCTLWQSADYVYLTERWTQFRLLVDGVVVSETPELYVNAHNVRMVADVPIASGTHVLSVAWRISSPEGTETATDRRMYWWGGQLLSINTTR